MADGSVRPMLGDAVFNDRRHHDLVGFLIGVTATGPAAQSATNPEGPTGASSKWRTELDLRSDTTLRSPDHRSSRS
jgi:hypothetical protein